MPDDAENVLVRQVFVFQARRQIGNPMLEMQGGADRGGGSPGVAAAPGPAEAAGVQSPTKGGGMSDDREARRLAVEEAARALTQAWLTLTWTAGQVNVLAEAVRRLDAPRYEARRGDDSFAWRVWINPPNAWLCVCEGRDARINAEKIAALLNDAEGRP